MSRWLASFLIVLAIAGQAASQTRISDLPERTAVQLTDPAQVLLGADVLNGSPAGTYKLKLSELQKMGALVLDNITAMASTSPKDGQIVVTAGRGAAGDGGADVFRYHAASGATVDNVFVHDAPGAGAERFVRAQTDSITLKQGGIKDDSTDQTTALQALVTAAASRSTRIYCDEAMQVRFQGTLLCASNSKIDTPNVSYTSFSGSSAIAWRGTTGSSIPVFENIPKHSGTVKITTKGSFVAGDKIVLVDSPEAYENSTKTSPQELFTVMSVDAAPGTHDVVSLSRGTAYYYAKTVDEYVGNTIVTACSARKVTPVANCRFSAKQLSNIKIDCAIAENVVINVGLSDAGYGVQTSETIKACDRMDLTISTTHALSSGPSGANSLIDAWANSKIKLISYGGDEDGARLRGCSNVDADLRVSHADSRGAHLYRCTGLLKANINHTPVATTGNVEVLLIDSCDDLVVDHPVVTNYRTGDGMELRSLCRQVEVRSPIVQSDPNGSGFVSGINIHSNGLPLEATINGRGLIQTMAARGLRIVDSWEMVAVSGLTVRPDPANTTFIPLTVGDTFLGPMRGCHIRDCRFIQEGDVNNTISIGSPDVIQNVSLTNCEFDLDTPADGKTVLATARVNGLSLRNITYIGASYNTQVSLTSSTNVSLEQINLGYNGKIVEAGVQLVQSIGVPQLSGGRLANPLVVKHYDTFTDTNGVLITAHTPDFGGLSYSSTHGTEEILSNRLRLQSIGSTARIDIGHLNSDAEAVILMAASDTTVFGLLFRYVDINNWAEARIDEDADTLSIIECISGSENVRATSDVTITNGVSAPLFATLYGNLLTASFNGAIVQGTLSGTATTVVGLSRRTGSTGGESRFDSVRWSVVP